MRTRGRRTLTVDGRAASVFAVGRGGVPALLLHGFAGDLLTWQYNLSPLAARRLVVAADLPGHGASSLDVGDGRVESLAVWVEGLLDALELPRVHVVGHSMGGLIGLFLADRAPGRVASLSLIAPAGLQPDYDVAFLARLTGMAAEAEAEEAAARLFAGANPLVQSIARGLLAQAGDPDRRAALQAIVEGSIRKASWQGRRLPDWRDVAPPIRILWGDRDRIIPFPADRLSTADPRITVFADAGHLPHAERPGPVTDAVAEFLTRVDGA